MTGGGKSFRFVAPNLLNYNSNYIVTDPSSELTDKYGKYLENNGYRVDVFNTVRVKKSLRYNPFAYIKSDMDIILMVDTFIKNTTGKGEKSGEKFWVDCERMVLYAICGYLWHLRPIEEQNFKNVLKLLKKAKIDENNPDAKSELDLIFERFEEDDPGNSFVSFYKDYKAGAGKSLKSILISVNARCSKLELHDIQYLTEIDELDLTTFADSRRVLFIQVPEGSSSFNFLVSMLYSQLFMILYNYAEQEAKYGYKLTLNGYSLKTFRANNNKTSKIAKKQAEKLYKSIIKNGTVIKTNKTRRLYEIYSQDGTLITWSGSKQEAEQKQNALKNLKLEKCEGKCPNHVRMILDEFANIGEIPDFVQKLSTIRKYEISCAIIIQTYGQLKRDYKEDADNIAGNCSTKLFFGSTDPTTIEWMQKLFDKKAITVKDESYSENGKGSTSYKQQLVPLISATKIKNLKKECIVMVDKQSVYIGPVYDTLNDPKFKIAMKTKGKYVYPKNDFDEELYKPLRERSSYINKVLKQQGILGNVNKNGLNNNLKSQNKSKKIASQHAQELLAQHDETDVTSDSYQNAAVEGLLKSLELGTPPVSEATIKDTVESIISFQTLPLDNIFTYKID